VSDQRPALAQVQSFFDLPPPAAFLLVLSFHSSFFNIQTDRRTIATTLFLNASLDLNRNYTTRHEYSRSTTLLFSYLLVRFDSIAWSIMSRCAS
jgi:hypothetical protein